MSAFHPVEHKVYRFIREHSLIHSGDHILLGVSGGPDSIAMVQILLELRQLLGVSKYSVIHVNHGIRPESVKEEEFVVSTMKTWGIEEVVVERPDVKSVCRQYKLSIEMGARLCRHEAFENTRKRLGAHKIALAHQSDDQAEELVLRFFRGASFESLEGMRPFEKEKHIIRPLLSVSRKEILAYLSDKNVYYVEDSSNLSPYFQRNRVRLELLPLAEDIFKRPVAKVINRFTDIAAQENDYWEGEILRCWEIVCLSEKEDEVILDAGQFAFFHIAFQRRLIRYVFHRLLQNCYGISYAQIEALRKLITESQSGRMLKVMGLSWIKEGSRIIARRNKSLNVASKEICDILPVPGVWKGIYNDVPLTIETKIHPREAYKPESPEAQDYVAFMDYHAIRGTLFVRNWRPGDRFQPLGMKGHSKKVQDYLTDLKIPRSIRRSVLLVTDSEKICCVLGYRIDDRVKVRPETELILELRVKDFFTNTRSDHDLAPGGYYQNHYEIDGVDEGEPEI